jgi:acyl-CoA thioester hydrolase
VRAKPVPGTLRPGVRASGGPSRRAGVKRREIRPPDTLTAVVHHRVPFYETDAMGIVHHANYLRYLEIARVAWMDAHDRPYRDYVADGLHFATTHVEIDYQRSAAFDDMLEISTWMEWVRGASLRMAYVVKRQGEVLAVAATEHAMVDLEGRPRRIPRERRDLLAKQVPGDA